MMCPVCKRDLAPTLSICLTCGAMINDTVREELQAKVSRTAELATSNSVKLPPQKSETAHQPEPTVSAPKVAAPIPQPTMAVPPTHAKAVIPAPPANAVAPTPQAKTVAATPKVALPSTPSPKPIAQRFNTNDLRAKQTSQTLVEFQTKKATVPEWRLQLQNSIRQKAGTNRRTENDAEATSTKPRTTNGANALKVEFVEDEKPSHQNPRVASALKRIEESRRVFSNQDMPEQSVHVGKNAANRNYPFNVVARSAENAQPGMPPKATVNPSPKPMLVSPLRIEKKGFDTNKLPPLKHASNISERLELPASTAHPAKQSRIKPQREQYQPVSELELEMDAVETDDIEDLAPLSMRFSAGVFDFIVGIFSTLILLSPFMLSGGNWLSLSGFFAIAASVAIVMFLYLTVSIAFLGRTLGMRLFSLELVDVEENAYPTLHQSAVNSAVFLLSLAFAGLGFVPLFFNEERRAAHDILSGTILIREY